VFLESQTDASVFGQGVFDFTNTANSGRWSTLQQLYNLNQDDTEQDVVYRRLKCRGKGRAIQLRFEGDPGAPFTVIGWNIWATSNASV
jgi:hypothetical protein